jgi:hypothetical protein
MRAPAIVPTTTQRVRRFLSQQGAVLRPWTGLKETYDELYALLRRRQGDPEFWQPLKALLQEVVDSAADSQRRGSGATPATELLDTWQVDKLVDELRDALPPEGNGASPTRVDFTRMLSSAVLGGFLLLGLAAAGCNGDSPGGGADLTGGSGGAITMSGGAGGRGEGGSLCNCVGGTGAGGAPGTGGAGAGGSAGAGATGTGGAAGTGGAVVDSDASREGGTAIEVGGTDGPGLDSGADQRDGATVDPGQGEVSGIDGLAAACTQAVDPELDRAIGESTLGASQKGQLCDCFAALSTSWITSLTQLFATATPTEISRMLSGLTSCCHSDGMMTLHGLNAAPTSSDLQNIKNGSAYLMCSAVVYKGVSFPD